MADNSEISPNGVADVGRQKSNAADDSENFADCEVGRGILEQVHRDGPMILSVGA